MGPPARKRMAVEAVTTSTTTSSDATTTTASSTLSSSSLSSSSSIQGMTTKNPVMVNPNGSTTTTHLMNNNSTNGCTTNNNNQPKIRCLAILQEQQKVYGYINNNSNSYNNNNNILQYKWLRTVQFAHEINHFCTTTTNFTGTTVSQLLPILIRTPEKNHHKSSMETIGNYKSTSSISSSSNNNVNDNVNNNNNNTSQAEFEDYNYYEPYIIELQLLICRKIRELILLGIITATTSLLPNNMYLCFCTIHTMQYYQWIPILLAWQRPPKPHPSAASSSSSSCSSNETNTTNTVPPSIAAVQIEALLAVTSIAELLCTTETPSNIGSLCHYTTAMTTPTTVPNTTTTTNDDNNNNNSNNKSSSNNNNNSLPSSQSSSHRNSKIGNRNNNNNNNKSNHNNNNTLLHHYQNCILAATVGSTNTGSNHNNHHNRNNYNNHHHHHDNNNNINNNNNTNGSTIANNNNNTIIKHTFPPFPPLSFHQWNVYHGLSSILQQQSNNDNDNNNNSHHRTTTVSSSYQQQQQQSAIETYMEFDASIVQMIQENKNCFIIPPPMHFPNTDNDSSSSNTNNDNTSTSTVVPYVTSSSSSSMIPSALVTNNTATTSTSIFPQPLSIKAQNIFLRHREAISTLIVLLSSPSQQVYEQAVLILGSIAAGDACPPPSSTSHYHNTNPVLNNNNNFTSSSSTSLNDTTNSGNMFASSSSSTNDGMGSGRNNSNMNDNNNNGKMNNNNSSNGMVPSARDFLLASGVMSPLLHCLESHPTNLSLQRIGSWTISTLLDNIFQQPASAAAAAAAAAAAVTSSNNNNSSMNNNNTLSNPGGSSSLSSSDRPSAAASLLNHSVSSMTPSNTGGQSTPNMGLSFGSGKNGSILMNSNNNNNISITAEYMSADAIDMNQLLPVLYRLLHMTDSEVLSYICWSLSYLCDGPSSHIAAVVTTPPDKLASKKQPPGGLVPRLVELLVHPSWRVTKPALRTIGNIVCAECPDDGNGSGPMSSNMIPTDYTEVILDCNAVPRLKELITHSNREIQKEAAWTLSNIAAGTVDQIQAVIDSGAIPPLVNLVKDKNTDQEVRSEACWVVLNATSCGCDSQIELLVDEGCVSVLGVLLSEVSMVMMALEGLERVLQVEEAREIIRRERIESGEIEDDESNRTPVLVSASLIESARESHNSSQVTKKAEKIWKHHFVYCALCRESYSRHRVSDASFCEECKCHVCKSCNCQIYHLDYQEELWAATEEQTEAKKNAKKSKNKKKKAKLKEKKASTKVTPEESAPQPSNNKGSRPPSLMQLDEYEMVDASVFDQADDDDAAATVTQDEKQQALDVPANPAVANVDKTNHIIINDNDDDNDSQNYNHSHIDLVLYLQQTGSIIALSKLMDALEYGGEDFDDELDEYERRMIQEQQLMRGQATN